MKWPPMFEHVHLIFCHYCCFDLSCANPVFHIILTGPKKCTVTRRIAILKITVCQHQKSKASSLSLEQVMNYVVVWSKQTHKQNIEDLGQVSTVGSHLRHINCWLLIRTVPFGWWPCLGRFPKIVFWRIIGASGPGGAASPTTGKTYIWGLSKIMVPENALTPHFREPFAPFRAQAESGHEMMIRFSFTYRFINIMVFRPFANLTPPFRGLSPLQQNVHIHICRCHSDTKSLAWVLGRLPYRPPYSQKK